MSNRAVHILRYGTVAEKTYLEKAISTYDYLSINGNSAAYVSRAISKFVVEKFFNDKNKGFIIDPITYAFQQDIHLLKSKSKATGEEKLRKSIKKLIDKYEKPANKVEDGVPIQPSDFPNDDPSLLKEFCYRVLDFQYSIISDYIDSNDLKKYLQYATSSADLDVLPQFHPKILVAPYFYLNPKDANFDSWLKLNIKFLEESLMQSSQNFGNIPVYGEIVISKDVLLNRTVSEKIVSEYKKSKCIGFSIWVDNFNEHEENQEMLNGFINFLQGLSGKPIYNMYGGFFSIMLTHPSIRLLAGVSHGLEYGESRAVYPVGGGIPVSRYYYMPLHQRKDFTKAFYLLEYNNVLDTSISSWGTCDKYYKEICKCAQCTTILENEMINFVKFESNQFYEVKRQNNITRRKKASPETKVNCLYHYLLCKRVEFSMMHKHKISDILKSLKIEKEKYNSSVFLDEGELDYMDNWYNVFSEYLKAKSGREKE
jgi:hypothetical protein